MLGKRSEPTPTEVLDQRRPPNTEVAAHQKNVSNTGLTGASALTVKQSILPITLVTILFFLWGFAYGLLDVLNAKFQTALNITAAKAGGTLSLPFPAISRNGWMGGIADIFLVQVCKAPILVLTSSGPLHIQDGSFASSATAGPSSLACAFTA